MSEEHKCNDVCVQHYNKLELKCPYCLEEATDSWEVLAHGGGESGTQECGYCDKKFEYGTEITYRDGCVSTLYYTTFQIEEEL